MRKVWKFAVIVLCPLVGITAIGTLFSGNMAYATPSLQTAMIARYPGLRDTPLQDCGTCHMPVKADFLNSYGLALRDANMKFEEIEALDSDGDGVKNIDEIKNESFPGSHATAARILHLPCQLLGEGQGTREGSLQSRDARDQRVFPVSRPLQELPR